MTLVPSFRLYASDGTTLLYTFSYVNYTNAPQSPRRVVEIEGIRGQGGIIIDGGIAMWDLILRGILTGSNYEEVSDLIDNLENNVQANTKYVLKFDKSPSETYTYNVKRIEPITYPESLRVWSQRYEVTFRVNSW